MSDKAVYYHESNSGASGKRLVANRNSLPTHHSPLTTSLLLYPHLLPRLVFIQHFLRFVGVPTVTISSFSFYLSQRIHYFAIAVAEQWLVRLQLIIPRPNIRRRGIFYHAFICF